MNGQAELIAMAFMSIVLPPVDSFSHFRLASTPQLSRSLRTGSSSMSRSDAKERTMSRTSMSEGNMLSSLASATRPEPSLASTPSTSIEPSSKGMRSSMHLKNVLFPTPLRPNSPYMFPVSKTALTPSRTLLPPKVLTRSFTSSFIESLHDERDDLVPSYAELVGLPLHRCDI